ncbi:hypothetical protein GUJ93_ZPchr0010g10456 [Zizania palustris]|uniref:Uncharacterized protein n=1 Tax=Zizania palustris TaxID=103762 RepID=A0A8J5WFS0_ZIZPA|nr:hypothetical protein GUJ93_ZPchr0010g10456 [Zizania palustris]
MARGCECGAQEWCRWVSMAWAGERDARGCGACGRARHGRARRVGGYSLGGHDVWEGSCGTDRCDVRLIGCGPGMAHVLVCTGKREAARRGSAREGYSFVGKWMKPLTCSAECLAKRGTRGGGRL